MRTAIVNIIWGSLLAGGVLFAAWIGTLGGTP